MNTQEKIRNIIRTVSSREVSVGPDDSLFDAGLLDSFTLIDMVAAIEKEFGVKIPDGDLSPRKFSSISRVESYLEARK